MMRYITIFIIAISLVSTGCKSKKQQQFLFTAKDIDSVMYHLTELMVHDITNPPLASRFFAYPCISAYEIVSQNDTTLPPLYGRLNDYPKIAKPDSPLGSNYQLSAILAMLATAQQLQPSGKLIEEYRNSILDSCRRMGIDEDMIEQSMCYALAVSDQVLVYARSDGYAQISNYPRYSASTEPGLWHPTPPAFMAAIEPYFNTLRPFTLDSAAQYKPDLPIPFSTRKGSTFYKELLKHTQRPLSSEEKQIAAFWDCNPFVLQDNGHLIYALKKISPAAHWIGITGIACKKSHLDFNQSIQVFCTVAIGLMDAFISCWDEKYRSNRIRPETAIRKYIDPGWVPFLQTPPFPEYPSGHSVVSATAAIILTHFFGENFSYTDNVEVDYGISSRPFSSFTKAAEEAAISRFYGGIHFRDAIEQGLQQGKKVGSRVLEKCN